MAWYVSIGTRISRVNRIMFNAQCGGCSTMAARSSSVNSSKCEICHPYNTFHARLIWLHNILVVNLFFSVNIKIHFGSIRCDGMDEKKKKNDGKNWTVVVCWGNNRNKMENSLKFMLMKRTVFLSLLLAYRMNEHRFNVQKKLAKKGRKHTRLFTPSPLFFFFFIYSITFFIPWRWNTLTCIDLDGKKIQLAHKKPGGDTPLPIFFPQKWQLNDWMLPSYILSNQEELSR